MKLIRIRERQVSAQKKIDILELFSEDKLTVRKIALIVGMSESAVNKVLYDNGVSRQTFSKVQGATDEEAEILAKASAIRKNIVRAKRRNAIRERVMLTADLPSMGERFELYCCTLKDAPIEPGSVDVIITDPPYVRPKIHVFRTLGLMAGKWLKPGGALFMMCGQVWLPEIMELVLDSGGGLEYYWCMSWHMTGAGGKNFAKGRNVTIGWKPILWFTKGRWEGRLTSDVVKSDSGDHMDGSKVHHWGQYQSGFGYLVKAVTKVGDVVCDPFVGGGTTGLAALRAGRRFIGVDISREAIETTKSRIWEMIGSNGNHE